MGAAPLESSSTPHPASASQATSGSYCEPMEDTDSQSVRKRPRLDSGNHLNDSMSMSTPSPTGPEDQENAPAASLVASPSRASEASSPSLNRPSSRVTINMKSPTLLDGSAAPSTSQPSPTASHEASTSLPRPADDAPAVTQTPIEPETQTSGVISITSSPTRSLEIEVAEVEDMDQNPSTSQWRSLQEALETAEEPEVVQIHEHITLVESFPQYQRVYDQREVVVEVAHTILRSHPHDVAVFLAVKAWLDLCVSHLDQITYESFIEDHEFWEEIPTLCTSLIKRQVDFLPDEGQGPWACLEGFFTAYAHLTLHLVRLDTLALKQLPDDGDTSPDLLSRLYLPAFSWMLQVHNIPFYKFMERSHGSEVINLVARLNDAVAVDTIIRMSGFADALLKHVAQWPALTPSLLALINIVHNLVESAIERRNLNADDNLISPPPITETLELAYPLMKRIDQSCQSFVAKKASWLTSDTSDSLLRFIGNVYFNTSYLLQDMAPKIARDLGVQVPDDAKLDEYPQIILYGWKFQLLKKQIMDGRMELRVNSMEMMQNDLVGIWRQHIQGNPAGIHHPIIQYLVKFLRDSNIVEYVVGVESHPQLISRSGNVVGFLVVTSTYTDRDTDTIWNTVTGSQDPRTVAEVLVMLSRTFSLHQSSSNGLQYLCTKLIELPLNRFDTKMIEYCEQLLTALREQQAERMRSDIPDYPHADVAPHRLCVRLIREAASVPEFNSEQQTYLQRFAGKQLSLLLSLGLNDSDKMDMYRQCMNDIAEMNEFTVGSIHALNALIPPYDNQDIRKLALDFDFTGLIITELVHAFDTTPSDFSDPAVRNSLLPRIQLLHRIIDKVPDTVTDEMADRLWDSVFMSRIIGDQGRNVAWDILSKAASRSGRRNSFVDRYMRDYLPRVRPEDLSLDILSFAEQAVSYEIRFDPPPVAQENEVIAIPGMERIWQFILTALPGTIEMKATSFAIEVYLDHTLIRRAPRSSAEATHVALVDRCVEQLKAASSKLKSFGDGTTSGDDEPMVLVPSDGEIREEELRFSRSLLFLKQLLQGLRTRPQYTPPRGSPPTIPLADGELKGNLIGISYQAFSGNSQTPIRSLQIGDLNTVSELVEKLVRLTGFSKFSAISGGQRLDLIGNGDHTLRDLKLSQAGLLIIRKHPEAPEISIGGRRQSLSLVDSEVLKHFDDLYDLLGLEERLAKETEPNQEFVLHCINVLVSFLTRPEMSDSIEENPLKLTFACSFVECLLLVLTAKVTPDNSQPCFSDPTTIATQLLNLISLGWRITTAHISETAQQKLISNAFAALVEASMHDNRVWAAVKESTQVQTLISSLLLEETRPGVRKGVAEIISTVCGISPTHKLSSKDLSDKAAGPSEGVPTATTVDIVATLWKSITVLFPETPKYAPFSQEFFEVALIVFQTVAALSPGDLVYGEYLQNWGDIMLSHETHEFVGREPIDYIILGFTHLIKLCLELAGSNAVTANTRPLMESLFTKYLFPDLSGADEFGVIQPTIPVMHVGTRQEIYNVLMLLCGNLTNAQAMLELLSDIIPHDYTYEPNWVFDRTKTIRTPEGYAGLKNLSNTCYLNSLFTQLFMNVNFRKFMLNLRVSSIDGKQQLLAETKKVFGYMQNTWQKCVDTQAVVDTIRTYDNEPVDINIQMDVDEFYNLLFDRWEGQILSNEAKKAFRSFYGGQLVQQIKSKECTHISERLEPFSAIQCDIKGKSGLEDSLRAYVEGEIMQGDNKYSCTSCGRHVDAVKRACLKDVPDNLIFHLKRFDFDVISMVRSKINDEFHFPERIDMTPFTVEHLSNPNDPIAPDIFELVGVLVHSGTAESGHYYSYIRERPTAANYSDSWVEFNDSDVSRFEPSKIPDQCFGGMNDSIHGAGLGQIRYNKVWNAYMLFYQRVKSMEEDKSVYQPSIGDFPVNVSLPVDLGNHISMENEVFIRTYCLLDPYHAFFIRTLLEQSGRFPDIESPETAMVRRSAIEVTLDTLDQLIARTKDLAELEPIVIELLRAIATDAQCASTIVRWTIEKPLTMRNLLLKCPNPLLRSRFCRIMVMALARLRDQAADGSLSPQDLENAHEEFARLLEGVVAIMGHLWTTIHLHFRAWDDYFELLVGIADLGSEQVGVLLEHGFLLKCLEMVWLDNLDTKKLKRQYVNYYRLIEKGRKYSHYKLVELLYILMTHIDLSAPPTEIRPRPCTNGKFPLHSYEAEFVRPMGRTKEVVFLKKVLEQGANHTVALKFMALFLDAEPEAGMLEGICKILEEGLRVSPASLCTPFLEATLLFCQLSSDADMISYMIDFVAKGVDSINESGGQQHLAFFQSLLSHFENDNIDKDETWFWTVAVDRTPDWAPTLLHYPDRLVRASTTDLLRTHVFGKDSDELEDEHRQFYARIARDLCHACVDRLQRYYVIAKPAPLVDTRSLENITAVITHSLGAYFDEAVEEDAEFMQQAGNTIATLEQLGAEVPDELVSGKQTSLGFPT
ncbi:hypothetical protein AJ80_02257 [Polytolypa hystricis UAMH7299]|uniref:USP domain-containing protein n=1 Tax=Polytolypa hystricis (strain UAMH7299) TaxID=1447883 RepID=A0A2B7YRG6_POLH7|nr:hypothetical protein AJ80_02257 [Polytolypa hystricis UAMH7299]